MDIELNSSVGRASASGAAAVVDGGGAKNSYYKFKNSHNNFDGLEIIRMPFSVPNANTHTHTRAHTYVPRWSKWSDEKKFNDDRSSNMKQEEHK